jgi:Protein of unknown function (DUF4019)
MNHVVGIILAALVLFTAPARTQEVENVASAQAAAQSWLALIDSGQYDRSWDQAADLFQARVYKPDWINAVRNARSPLGSLTTRKVKSAKAALSLPGAPDGEYVIIRYESQFEHKTSAIETITPLREKDGSWKVSGYFIK